MSHADSAPPHTKIAQALIDRMWAWYESRPLYPKYPAPIIDAKGRLHRARTPVELIHRHITRTQQRRR